MQAFRKEDLAQVIDELNRTSLFAGKCMFVTIIFLIQESGQKVILELRNEVL